MNGAEEDNGHRSTSGFAGKAALQSLGGTDSLRIVEVDF